MSTYPNRVTTFQLEKSRTFPCGSFIQYWGNDVATLQPSEDYSYRQDAIMCIKTGPGPDRGWGGVLWWGGFSFLIKIKRMQRDCVLLSCVIVSSFIFFPSSHTCIWEETSGLLKLGRPRRVSGSCWSGTEPCVLSEPHKKDSEHSGCLKRNQQHKKCH